MLDKYVVVTAKKNFVPAFENMAFGFAPANIHEQVQVVEADLSARERLDIQRDPTLRALAPAMPMQLIKPLKSGGTAGIVENACTWGVEAVGALSSPYDGEGVTVAVLDTGINPSHPAFSGVELVCKNFSTDANDNDINGHGTHCAGTVFGRAVDGKRIGVAPGVRRALIGKVLGETGGDSAVIAKAINWASQEGANVISMSLGIDFPNYVKFLVELRGLNIDAATSIALEGYRANINLFSGLANYLNAASAFNQGVLLVAAAGNESMRPDYSIAVAPPAASSGFVSVGALHLDREDYGIAYFSNNHVDIAAPGVDVTSASFSGGLTSLSGTSMATPHVAGVAALWAQRQLKLTGYVESVSLAAQVRGSGSMARIKAGVLESDVGSGIVQAPAG